MRRRVPFVLLLAVAACDITVNAGGDCDSQSCHGCCTSAGKCEPGDTTQACGADGAMCQDCGAAGKVCGLGMCVGGAGGGTAGGAAGGSAGGVAGGSAGGVAGGSAGGTAGGSAGGSAGGVAGGSAGGVAGGSAGGAAGGSAGGAGGGTAAKPNLMILLDKSGSMAMPMPGGTNCGTCTYPTCPEATCPTRIGVVRQAMGAFLTTSGRIARMGLTIYPADNMCAPAGSTQVLTPVTPPNDSDVALQAWANGINTQIQGQMVGGGTPTGASLAFVGTIPDLKTAQRDDYVLLLTDGLPNCNATNPNVCTMPAACKCTLNAGQCGTVVNDSDPNNFCRRGCLDQDGSVAAVTALRSQQIRTIVLGFGSDFVMGNDGFDVLNAMAAAGGVQRTCPNGTQAECGTGNVCVTGNVCQQGFYSAATAAELATALTQISLLLAP